MHASFTGLVGTAVVSNYCINSDDWRAWPLPCIRLRLSTLWRHRRVMLILAASSSTRRPLWTLNIVLVWCALLMTWCNFSEKWTMIYSTF